MRIQTMAKRKLVIIGNGMAGAKLLEDLLLRHATRRYSIEVYGEESVPAYNRVLLGRVLAGEDGDAIRFEPPVQDVPDVQFHRGLRVDRIDTMTRQLHTSDGQKHPYDIAVISTGSRAFIPRVEGLMTTEGSLKVGVYAYRTLDDALSIRSAARAGGNAIVLGGGLLGLEGAKVLADSGMHVTIVHLAGHLMERQLDPQAGEALKQRIMDIGLFVRCGRTITRVHGDSSIQGVTLDDGTFLPAEMLVMACGIRPRVELAQQSGIPVNRGIIVNDTLATAIPGIYAIGECAEHAGQVYGMVQPIFEQSSVLADILSGEKPTSRYRGSRLYARLKIAGVEVASMGVLEPELPEDEVVQITEHRKKHYRKLIIRQDRLIGAMFVGDPTGAAAAIQAFDRGEPLPANRLELLCESSVSSGKTDRDVCNCKQVRLSVIRQAIQNGCDSVESIATCTGAGTGCGSCRSEIARILNQTISTTATH